MAACRKKKAGASWEGGNEKQWYGYETTRFRNLDEMPSIFLDTSAAQAQTSDLLRSYLRDIGRVPLLTRSE